jgi:hypothetical protein
MQFQNQNSHTLLFVKAQYSRKAYTTTERRKALLPAIETCKEYKHILLGYLQPILVVTDHKISA